MSVQILTSFVSQWATVAGFNTFIYEKIIPTCFAIPLSNHFDFDDAVCNSVCCTACLCFFFNILQILIEIITLMKHALNKLNGEFAQYMKQKPLPLLGLSEEQGQIFLVQLQNASEREFKKLFVELFKSRKQ